MKKLPRFFDSKRTWAHLFTGLGLVGACTVVDKGDYTFTDNPDGDSGGEDGTGGGKGGTGKGGTAGSSSGSTGKGGTSGDGGEGNLGGTGGKGGTSGDAGDGSGGGGGLCDPDPCVHGRCTSDGVKADCACDPGYQGLVCDEDIDECNPNPCINGGTCEDLVADFNCVCRTQFTGKTCDLPRFEVVGPMGPNSYARSVSADGTVVLGRFADPQGYYRPFYWTRADGGRPVPIPNALRPDVHITPWSISGNGLHWVGEVRSATGTTMSPPTPVGGAAMNPGNFGLPPNAIAGGVFDVDDGATKSVGYFTDGMNNSVRGVIWDSQGMPLPLMNPYPGSPFYAAGAVTRDGTIVTGTAKDTTNNVYVVSWIDNPGTTPPPTRRAVPGTQDLEVHGVSADGMIAVGTFWDTAFANFAFVTQGTAVFNIAPMVGAVLAHSNVWDVSDDGQVLVGDAELMGMTSGMPVSQAVVFKADGSFRPVFDLLRDVGSAPPMGWTLSTAYGVSADGKVVVGLAFDQMGQTVGYIARLP